MFVDCQWKLVFLCIFVFGHVESQCMPGWESRGSFCYQFVSQNKNWADSESYCQSNNGHLISFADAAERDWAYHAHIGPSGVKWWIGLNDIDTENTWVWSDGTVLDTNVLVWRTGEPNNNQLGQHCAAYEGGSGITADTFNDESCSNNRFFACKTRDDANELCDVDRGFDQFGSSCYNLVNQDMIWHDAENYCYTQFDSHLSSILTDDEQKYVFDQAKSLKRNLWLGLSDSVVPGTLAWSNGHDAFIYNNWADGQPIIENGGSSCTKLVYGNGTWLIARCSETRPFMCKKGLKTTCPDGWVYGHGKCYEFHLNSNLYLPWFEARDYCRMQNSRLIQIESTEQQNFLAAYYAQWRKDGVLQLWIGASDSQRDNELRWSDDSLISYSEWDGDVYSKLTAGVDDCAWLYDGKNDNNWEIGNCFSLQAFGCEINEGVNLSEFPKPLVNYTCPDGWRLYDEHCYLFHTKQLNWDDAEAFCGQQAQYHSHLVSIHNALDNSFIAGHLNGQSWSGMTDRLYEGNYVWSDGTITDFFNWKYNQPSLDGDCIRIVGIDDDNAWGSWNDRNCSETIYPICKLAGFPTQPHYPPTADPSPDESLCGTNYLHNAATHKCYKIEGKYWRTWADARLHCQQEGGDLLSINIPAEQDYVEAYIKYLDTDYLWTGGFDAYNGPDFFPDLIDAFDGGWEWSDGSPFNFVNWNGGEPNNVEDEDCMHIRTGDGLWNDISCEYHYPFICEKEDPAHSHEDEHDQQCSTADCCFRHLGVEVGGSIPDEQLSASSQWSKDSPATRGRLNMLDQHVGLLNLDIGPGLGGWIAADNDVNPWFQIDLIDFMEVRGIVTQGRNGYSQPENQNDWVKQYSVKYMINHATKALEDYKDLDGTILIFDANYDQDTQVTNVLPRPIVTRAIRILPTNCRKKCAMRVELLGCTPTCDGSLGLSNQAPTVLPDESFSASSQQPGFEAYNARLAYSSGDLQDMQYLKLDSSTFTYDSAREYCVKSGGDLCSAAEICPNGKPVIVGILPGDQWAPIRDSYNNWIELGNDNGDAGRICYVHNDHYAPPGWGITEGQCDQWSTPQDPCPLKGNLFCCPVNLKSWKPTQNTKNEFVQVDLGMVKKVSGVIVQGAEDADDWVTDYYVQFSDDGTTFTTYETVDGGSAMFPGSIDRFTPVEGFLREAISTRYIRVNPQAWNNNIALRMDIMGCDVGNVLSCTDEAASYDDDTFVVACPTGCDTVTDKLWGTSIYTDDSYICAAAIHDGRIKANHGGTVTVKKVQGQASYQGSTQHGIASKSYASWPGSFIFQGDHLGCPTGWSGWKDWCYYTTRKGASLNYADAEEACQFYGGELASIHTQAEQDFVTSLIVYQFETIANVWIGMNDFDVNNYFLWSDGTDVTYTRWNFNEPNGGDSEHCVQMYKWSGLWNDKPCDSTMNYVCKMDKVPVNQAQEQIDGCPTGWLGNEASCYLFDITSSVWTNAEDFCQSQGGHLATVNNYFEQMYLTSQAAQASHEDDDVNFFIGLGAFVNPQGALTFNWSSGEPITFTAWAPDEPYIAHACVFPFQYQGVEYYECISKGRPYELLGGPWCSADPIYVNHPVPCEGRDDGQVGCIVMDKNTGYWSQSEPVGCAMPQYRICEIPRTGDYTTPQAPTPPAPVGNCPAGWHSSQSSTFCYELNERSSNTDKLSWEEAKRHCESQGANLASIHSAQEEQVITSGRVGTDASFWIGMKRQPDGNLGWSDKSPVSYTHWGTGEPNNYGGREECVQALLYTDNSKSYWNDINCESVMNWICKIERGKDLLPAISPPPGTLSPQICGSDAAWVAYTPPNGVQKCYYFANSPVQSWHAANLECQGYGGSLVTISSLDEQLFITGRAADTDIGDMWIGLVQDGMDGPYIWVDKSPLVFENWIGGQPDNQNGHELCVMLYSNYGLWSDTNCGYSNGFICQKQVGAQPQIPTTPAPIVGGCPTGWIPYGGKCFLEVGFTDRSLRATWVDAEQYCEDNGGFLAALTNQYYNAFIASKLFAAPSNIYIGFNSRETQKVFTWTSNEDVAYTNWAPNEPNNQDGIEQCTEMIWKADNLGKWNDRRCDDVLPFYCSRDKDPNFPINDQSTAPDCPTGHDFVQWDTGCYKIHSKTSEWKNWQDARDACRQEGAALAIAEDLTSIWNSYENNFIKTFFWPQTDGYISDMWTGLYYKVNNSETTYYYSDDSPVVFTAWGTNEPQLHGDADGCVAIDQYGTWLNKGSSTCRTLARPYVCKHETLTIPVQDPGVGKCEANWAALGDYCYYIESGENSNDHRSWGDADYECQTKTGYLASIHSDIENKAFVSWIAQRNVWIGLKRNGWGGWDWSDKSAVDFVNWADGEPNNVGDSDEACVELYTNGGWNDLFCSEKKGYVCKKHKQYSTCDISIDNQVDCGYDGISQYECVTRGCCWDETGTGPHLCYYSRSDADCLNKGGTCKDYRGNVCELGYEQFLCSGVGENRCCFECDDNDDTCNADVASWEENDQVCELGGYGICQYNSNYCPSKVYETNKCGGPGLRQCCVANPVTKPTDGPVTTTTTPAVVGPTTTLPGGSTPPVQTQTTPTKITTTTDVNVNNGNNGLDAGGIAGIVIAVIFVVVAIVVGVVLYQRTNSKNPFTMPVLGSNKHSTVSSFDNPIMFSKDTVSMEGADGLDSMHTDA